MSGDDAPALTPGPAPGADSPGADFAQYYGQHMARLVRHLMRQGAAAPEAADAVQAAFEAALPQWHQIQHPGAWLRLVATRALLRRPAREILTDQTPDQPDQNGSPLGEVVLEEQERRVLAALDTLPPRQRVVMAWHRDGFSHAEIAAALDMTPETVRKNVSRARARLKPLLLDTDDGGGR
ncbi:RNA polymerase sigma factor [Streptomyces sp. NPDC057702]|uniref:RNA polymerase sigma factor n=1 Tax=Streptomyces sp. NPDC057702 TaxID=3346221 RepID=UPI0036782EE3